MALILDDTDPCTTAATLRGVYANLVAGQTTQEVMFRAGPNGVERRVVYNKSDPGRLLALIRSYEQQCAAMQGSRPRRFGMRAGGGY